jgi:hypothetical protein
MAVSSGFGDYWLEKWWGSLRSTHPTFLDPTCLTTDCNCPVPAPQLAIPTAFLA